MNIVECNGLDQYVQGKVIEALEIVHAMAFENANKYRWDPTISSIHRKYLQEINSLINQVQENV